MILTNKQRRCVANNNKKYSWKFQRKILTSCTSAVCFRFKTLCRATPRTPPAHPPEYLALLWGVKRGILLLYNVISCINGTFWASNINLNRTGVLVPRVFPAYRTIQWLRTWNVGAWKTLVGCISSLMSMAVTYNAFGSCWYQFTGSGALIILGYQRECWSLAPSFFDIWGWSNSSNPHRHGRRWTRCS